MLRYIYDTARSAAMNMSIDETLFDSMQNESVLRIYFWDKAYTTIGYFQKNDCDAVRRLTGGLLVNHQNDLSFGFCTHADVWPYSYDQQATYKYIHTAIKKALFDINIESNFAEIIQKSEKNIFCVQTLYSDDLISGGRKIAGSCMRRRGKKILVQGSLHLDLGEARKEEFSNAFVGYMAEMLNTAVKKESISAFELEKASETASEKYLNPQWNNKF